ncbi:MAG: DUF4959 domain-containing protein, partial [Prevotellaceae bacterium]|nr:DUF4959 domain-containing protein [Prevotellaceae bacterium]
MKRKNIFEKMKTVVCFLIVLPAMFLLSCEEVKDWHDPTDSVPPGTLSNVTVKNINGGAWIYYSLPADNDLLGVKAEYAFEEGEELRNVFSSAFNDSILVEGYANTDEHTVTLYVIDKSLNESEPVPATVKPLIPPVEQVRQSLRLHSTFGGIYSEWENEIEKDLAIALYIKDSIGEFVLHDTYYTKARNGNYTFRNMKSEDLNLRIEIRDKWEHYATPVDTVIKPLFEEEIYGRNPVTQANIWQRFGYDDRTCLYRGDISETEGNKDLWMLYDGAVFQNSSWFHTKNNYLSHYVSWSDNEYHVKPIYLTIDMVRKASYSR